MLPISMQEWLRNALKSADVVSNSVLLTQSCESCDSIIDTAREDEDGEMDSMLPCYHSICRNCLTASTDDNQVDGAQCPICSDSARLVERRDHAAKPEKYTPSSKVKAVLKNLALPGSYDNGRLVKR